MLLGIVAGATATTATTVSTAACIDMFLSGAVASLTLLTTGSKIKRTVYSKKKK